jgi:hypothetical protein
MYDHLTSKQVCSISEEHNEDFIMNDESERALKICSEKFPLAYLNIMNHTRSKGIAIKAPDWQSLTRLCTDIIRDFSKFKILQLFILQCDIDLQILVHVVEYHNGNSNNLTTNNWIWQVQRQEEWTEHSKLWEENARDNIWNLVHIFQMLDKRLPSYLIPFLVFQKVQAQIEDPERSQKLPMM